MRVVPIADSRAQSYVFAKSSIPSQISLKLVYQCPSCYVIIIYSSSLDNCIVDKFALTVTLGNSQ